MAKKRKKSKKRIHQMPPLSFVDKLIYGVICAVLFAVYFSAPILHGLLRDKIAFSDDAVIASAGHASYLWFMVPWMTFFLMTFILWLTPVESRRPIFGLKNFKYGPPAWPRVYPLFMKNKPYVWVSRKQKEMKKWIAWVLLIVLLLSYIPFPWSLYGRDCLYADGGIARYNMFNRQTHEFVSEEISDIEIETYAYTTGRYAKRKHWGVRMVLRAENGKKFVFEDRDFRGGIRTETVYWLTCMTDLKHSYNTGAVHYDGQENLKLVIADRNLDQTEAEMLCQLFEQ